MSWEIALQSFSAGLAAIGLWFIYDLIREFKMFQKETRTDVSTLKNERVTFLNTVKQSELMISSEVMKMQKIQDSFSLEVKKSFIDITKDISELRKIIDETSKSSANFSDFLNKALEVMKKINDKVRRHEFELQTLKIEMGELTLFKEKNGK